MIESVFFLLCREVGGRKLTIETRLPNELNEFTGDLSVEGLQFWKAAFSAMTKPGSLATHETDASDFTKDQREPSPSSSDQKVILMPCKSAPSRERVQIWLQARKQFEQLQRQRKATVEREMTELARAKNKQQVADSPSSVAGSEKDQSKSDKTSPLRVIRRRGLKLAITRSQLDTAESESSSKDLKAERDSSSPGQNDGDTSEHSISPDSPILPPWQRTVLPSCTPRDHETTEQRKIKRPPASPSPGGYHEEDGLSPVNRPEKELFSPSPLSMKPMDEDSPRSYHLHSTPVSRRKQNKAEPTSTPPGRQPMAEGRQDI